MHQIVHINTLHTIHFDGPLSHDERTYQSGEEHTKESVIHSQHAAVA